MRIFLRILRVLFMASLVGSVLLVDGERDEPSPAGWWRNSDRNPERWIALSPQGEYAVFWDFQGSTRPGGRQELWQLGRWRLVNDEVVGGSSSHPESLPFSCTWGGRAARLTGFTRVHRRDLPTWATEVGPWECGVPGWVGSGYDKDLSDVVYKGDWPEGADTEYLSDWRDDSPWWTRVR